jgi:TfoX/Sxy family transcriptional regulator of competence genes
MAYNEKIADNIRIALEGTKNLVEKKMFGGIAFMVDDKMCLGVDKDRVTREDRLMVRVGTVLYEKFLFKKGSR